MKPIRGLIIRVDVNRTPVVGDCSSCGFESLTRLTVHHLTDNGVSTLADRIICGRGCAQ